MIILWSYQNPSSSHTSLRRHPPRLLQTRSEMADEATKMIGETPSLGEYMLLNNLDINDNQTRLLFWTLIRDLQRSHSTGWCPTVLNTSTVRVKTTDEGEIFVFIHSNKRKYEEATAIANYTAIEEILSGLTSQPQSLIHLIGMLNTDPLSNVYLISRHYAILPDFVRMSLISKLHMLPKCLDGENGAHLRQCIANLNASDTIAFHRKQLEHSGVENRPQISNRSGLNRWLLKFSGPEWIFHNARATRNVATRRIEPSTQLNQVLLSLEVGFPGFIPRVQEELHRNHLLEYLSINPNDPLL